MTIKLLVLLLLGMGNGLMHAFDADHIVAVSSLATSGKLSRQQIFRTAMMWSVGHGTMLIFIVLLVIGLGIVVPEPVFKFAEALIGLILLFVGIRILTPLSRYQIRMTRHSHGIRTIHTHLHDADHQATSDHRPVLVGMIHGVAGSAPLLAVLPALFQANYALAGLYILLFSLSVCVAMCTFGGLFGRLTHFICRKADASYGYLRRMLGMQAIVFGGYWIYHAY